MGLFSKSPECTVAPQTPEVCFLAEGKVVRCQTQEVEMVVGKSGQTRLIPVTNFSIGCQLDMGDGMRNMPCAAVNIGGEWDGKIDPASEVRNSVSIFKVTQPNKSYKHFATIAYQRANEVVVELEIAQPDNVSWMKS